MGELGCFLFFLALFFVATYPWVLIPLGILAVVVIVYAIKNPSKGGGGSGSYSGGCLSAQLNWF